MKNYGTVGQAIPFVHASPIEVKTGPERFWVLGDDTNRAITEDILNVQYRLSSKMRTPRREIVQVFGKDFFSRNDQSRSFGSGEGLDLFMREILSIRKSDPVKRIRKDDVH